MAHHMLVTNSLSLLYLLKNQLGVVYHFSKTMKNDMIMKLSIKNQRKTKGQKI